MLKKVFHILPSQRVGHGVVKCLPMDLCGVPFIVLQQVLLKDCEMYL